MNLADLDVNSEAGVWISPPVMGFSMPNKMDVGFLEALGSRRSCLHLLLGSSVRLVILETSSCTLSSYSNKLEKSAGRRFSNAMRNLENSLGSDVVKEGIEGLGPLYILSWKHGALGTSSDHRVI